jgi:hypothetical protein
MLKIVKNNYLSTPNNVFNPIGNPKPQRRKVEINAKTAKSSQT